MRALKKFTVLLIFFILKRGGRFCYAPAAFFCVAAKQNARTSVYLLKNK